MVDPDDVFDTEALRSSVLQAWRTSPTRLTEDSNTERDLRVGGYRDRLFVELAQNAADAAAQAGVEGHVRISLHDHELRIANTGAELDAGGVAALSALRASDKPEGTVGRFGVGFAAVLAVTSEPRIVSRRGGVRFSESQTRAAAGVDDAVPILRLPWPLSEDEPPVPEHFDTEVRLPLRIDPAGVLARIRAEVADVLLALPWLADIEVTGQRWSRTLVDGVVELDVPEAGRTRWLTREGNGCVWAVPVDDAGQPQTLDDDVLHAPTPTEEQLSLPARLFASVPVEPSRRRVLPEASVREILQHAAHLYPELVRAVPGPYRAALVPRGDFPRSEPDSLLQEPVVEALAEQRWLPAAHGEPLSGRQARVLGVDSAELVELLAEVIPGLVAAPLCGSSAVRTLSRVGATPVGGAELVDLVTGIERAPSWWHALYDALLAVVDQRAVDPEDLGALPVPLQDGRTVPGPRDALLVADANPVAGLDVPGLHVVHSAAAHPLLERLGAVRAGPAELLHAPAMQEAVQRSVEDALAGIDVRPLVTTVLRLVSETGSTGAEALALPTRSGDWRSADELVLPGSALVEILDPEALGEEEPLDVVDTVFASEWPAEVLTAVGVLEDVPPPDEEVLEDGDVSAAAGPEDDEDAPPIDVLDLIADDAWSTAIQLLAARPATGRALAKPRSRLRSWLANHALLGGQPPNRWRLPAASGLTGLFDPVPDTGLPEDLLTAIGVRTDLTLSGHDDAELLCARLGDPNREVAPGLTFRAHAVLAGVPPEQVRPPDTVRTVSGDVAAADEAVVLDAPWLTAVWPANRLVAGLDYAAASDLAEVVDLPLASEETTTAVTSAGEFLPWTDLPAIREVAELLGVELPEDGVYLHEQLTVGAQPVSWWYDGQLHAADTSEGLAQAFSWTIHRWSDHWRVTALLDDPDPRILL